MNHYEFRPQKGFRCVQHCIDLLVHVKCTVQWIVEQKNKGFVDSLSCRLFPSPIIPFHSCLFFWLGIPKHVRILIIKVKPLAGGKMAVRPDGRVAPHRTILTPQTQPPVLAFTSRAMPARHKTRQRSEFIMEHEPS
jgi:hypothetical protein